MLQWKGSGLWSERHRRHAARGIAVTAGALPTGAATLTFLTVALASGAVIASLFSSGRPPTQALTETDWVTVGDAHNAPDANGFGEVPYAYRIGRFEVTVEEYLAFLNAVAVADPAGLYHPSMGDNPNIAGILRTGTAGMYAYELLEKSRAAERRPITLVSWFDAARYANWIANGRPHGAQDATTTEDGAYALAGVVRGPAVPRNAINPNTGLPPDCWIPTENEWYKAAYFNPLLDNGHGGYTAFATQSHVPPGNLTGDGSNQANYVRERVYAATRSRYAHYLNFLSPVGSFRGSASYYGTFDQSGNVWEWNDLDGIECSQRGARGGFWGSTTAATLSSDTRCVYEAHTEEFQFIGIRLAGPVTLADGSSLAVAATPAPRSFPRSWGWR